LFDIDQQNSYYDPYSTFNSPVVITEQILNLPNLKGYGNLADLRIAIAKDAELQTLVKSFSENTSSGNISAARELMRPILLRWAGIDSSNTSSNFAQELAFLEKFVGRAWNNTNPSAAGIATIRNTFAQLESELETRLLAQVVQTSVEYNTTTEKYEFSGSINEVAEQFKQIAINSQTSSSETLNFEATVLGEFIQQSASRNNLVFNVFAANEDVTLEILASNISNADINLESNSLSFSGIQDAVNGTAVINADGNIEFTPAADFNGIAIIEYTVTDGTKTLTGLAQVNVAPVNDAPVANNDTATTEEDTPIIILATELLANDGDVDRDTLSITSVGNAVNGTAIINANGNIKFTPGANFNGIASFDYTVSDGINRDTASIEIIVNPVNDAPLASNDTVTAIDEDKSIIILAADLLGNDSDIEGDKLSIINVNSNSGTVILNAEGNIEFIPAANFNGTATFNYTVSDGAKSSTASVKLVINPINDILIANSDTVTTDEDTPIIILASELFKNDVNDDIEKSLVISQISNLTNGTAVINRDGNVQFTPNANFKGIASFDYTVTDGTDSETASVKVVVNSINDAPIANNDTVTTNEDTPIIILATELLSNDLNLDLEDSLSLIGVNNAVNGMVVINKDGNVEFTPAANFNGTANFDYVVTDGKVNQTASVKIVVNPVNDVPTLTNLIPNLTLTKNAANSVIKLADYFEDVENGDNLAYDLSATIPSFQSSSNSNKFFDVFSIDNTKTLTLGYVDDVAGTATVTVKVTDSANKSVETTFNVSVVNNIPVANNDTVTTNEDTPITILASELLSNDMGSNLSISGVNNSISGTAILDEYGNVQFTPNANFNGTASFSYTITDGRSTATGLVSVDVTSINDAPVLTNSIPNLILTQNAPNSVIQLTDYFEDVENGDNLNYSLRASSSIRGGTSSKFFDLFSINGTKALTLDYANSVIGTSTITVKVTDSGNKFVETAFTVSVIDVSENGDTLLGGNGNDYLAGKQGNDKI
jgi:hypothetical protein